MRFSSPVSALLVVSLFAGGSWTGGASARSVDNPVERSGLDMAALDPAFQPGDDFYEFANAGWERTAAPDPSRPVVTVAHEMQDKAYAQVREIIQQASTTPRSRIGALYASYLDEAELLRRGATPVRPWLDRIAAARSRRDIARLTGALMRDDIGGLVGMRIAEDDGAPGVMVLTLSQGGLGLPNRDYYLSADSRMIAVRTAYLECLTTLMAFAGLGDASGRAEAVLRFETALARAHWSAADSRDAVKTYNPMTVEQLILSAPGFDWRAFQNGLGVAQDRVVVAQPDALAEAARVFAATPTVVLRDAMRARMLLAWSRYLPPVAEQARFALYGTAINGATTAPPRWRGGVSLAINLLGPDVDRAYVDRHFSPQAKGQVEEIVRNLVAALDDRLGAAEWMAPETRAKAKEKLAATRFKIGYPEQWADDLDDGLVIRADDLIGNVARASEARFARLLASMDRPIDRTLWVSNVVTPNAYASAGANEVIFPAAILQPPMFDPEADAAFNYARIGATIGHELSHLFDDQGRKYDVSGQLGNWWTPADEAGFAHREQALIAQYSAYEPLPGRHIDGDLTLGENIADLAGLEIAWAAFLRTPEAAGPALDGYSPRQRFFLAWAQMWRARYQPEALEAQLTSDAHSPTRQRAWTVRNMDAWYAVFAVGPGSTMYLPPEARVRFW